MMSGTDRLREGVFVVLFGHREYDDMRGMRSRWGVDGAALEKLGGFYLRRISPPQPGDRPGLDSGTTKRRSISSIFMYTDHS
jgi:hypothetical protein